MYIGAVNVSFTLRVGLGEHYASVDAEIFRDIVQVMLVAL